MGKRWRQTRIDASAWMRLAQRVGYAVARCRGVGPGASCLGLRCRGTPRASVTAVLAATSVHRTCAAVAGRYTPSHTAGFCRLAPADHRPPRRARRGQCPASGWLAGRALRQRSGHRGLRAKQRPLQRCAVARLPTDAPAQGTATRSPSRTGSPTGRAAASKPSV